MIAYAGADYGNAIQILADEESRSINNVKLLFEQVSAKLNVPDLQASEDNLSRLSYLYIP